MPRRSSSANNSSSKSNNRGNSNFNNSRCNNSSNNLTVAMDHPSLCRRELTLGLRAKPRLRSRNNSRHLACHRPPLPLTAVEAPASDHPQRIMVPELLALQAVPLALPGVHLALRAVLRVVLQAVPTPPSPWVEVSAAKP